MVDDEYYSIECKGMIVNAMKRFGDPFTKQLGELFDLADTNNARILMKAFPEHFKDFAKIGLETAKRDMKTEE